MKSLIILIWLLFGQSEDPKYIIINDILYKIPESEIANMKSINNIQEKDITIFKFDKDSCFLSSIEWIKVPNMNAQNNDPYLKYRVKTTPLFILDDKFVDTEYIYQNDIQSIEPLHVDKAISIYGCKGLNPIFILRLQYGKKIQSKPVGAGAPKFSQVTSNSSKLGNDVFTIIGKTKGFKDSTMLYLKKAESGSLRDNLDSTLVINNSFTFKGTVSEPCQYFIHSGYTGWEGQPPESFYRVTFFVNNATIYLNDDIGNLKYSKILGSQLQNDNNEFNEMNYTNDATRDSINMVFMKLTPSDSVERKILGERSRKNYQAGIQLSMDFIKTHPASLISVWLLNIYKTSWGREKTKVFFNEFESQIQNTSYGKSVSEYIKQKEVVRVGDHFVDIELKNLNGVIVKLSSLEGKYILLDFWSAYCGPCRKEHPDLLKLYNQYRKKGFEIFAVSLDEKKESWQQAVVDDKINWITVSALKEWTACEAAMIYGVSGIPKSYLIDREGKIIAQDIRGEDLANKLKEIFNPK
jgi:peroxiredoxin